MTDHTESESRRAPSCVDCGTPTAMALVDAAAIEISWLCWRCLIARGERLGGHRHLEERAP